MLLAVAKDISIINSVVKPSWTPLFSLLAKGIAAELSILAKRLLYAPQTNKQITHVIFLKSSVAVQQ